MTLPPIENDSREMRALLLHLLPGNHPSSLRALSFDIVPYTDSTQGSVILRSHFARPPSEDDLELIKDLEAELYAATDDKFDYILEAQTTPIGTRMDLLSHIAWIDGAEAYRIR